MPVQAPAAAPALPVEQPGAFRRRPRSFGRQGGGGQRFGRSNRRPPRTAEKSEFDSKAIDIARVTRVTKGGKRFTFRSTVIVGDGKGRVGVGIGKGKDVAQSIQKATHQAKKHLLTVAIAGGTIPHQVEAKFHSAKVILKPSKGGVKAGGPVRVVAKLAGIHSLTGKLTRRTNNKVNIAMATIEALKKLKVESSSSS